MSETSSATPPLEPLVTERPSLDDIPVAQLRKIRDNLRALNSHPGWIYLSHVLLSQAAMRVNQLGTWQAYDTRDMVEQALLRGEANGFELLANWPEFLIAQIEKQFEVAGIMNDEDE